MPVDSVFVLKNMKNHVVHVRSDFIMNFSKRFISRTHFFPSFFLASFLFLTISAIRISASNPNVVTLMSFKIKPKTKSF